MYGFGEDSEIGSREDISSIPKNSQFSMAFTTPEHSFLIKGHR